MANADKQLSEAAQQMKGMLDDPYATPTEEPKEQVVETEQEEVVATQESEETEISEEPEVEAQAETEEEVREEGAEPEPESVELGADEFASLLGLEQDNLIVNEDGDVRIRVKGEKGMEDVTPEQLINAYQGNANLTNRSKEAAEKIKAHEQALDQFSQQTANHAQQAAITLEAINAAFESENGAIDWTKLQAEDPSTYAAKKVEMSERRQQLNALTQQTLAELDQAQQVASQEQVKLMQQKLVNEQKAMQDGFKSLGVKVDDDLEKGVLEYLNQTFSEEELNKMAPSVPLDRLSLMAYKAQQFDKGKAKVKEKQVKKVPKVIKSGAKPSASKVKSQQAKEVKQRHHKHGTTDSAADAIKGLGII